MSARLSPLCPPLLVLMLMLGGHASAQEAPADPPLDAPARPVVSEIVTSASANLRSFPGLIRAGQEVNLAFLVGGRLDSRPVQLGTRVMARDLIGQLNQNALEEDAAAARAALQAAQAQAQIAQQSYARAQELNRRGVAPQSSLEQAQAAMQTSAATALAAQEAVTRAEDAASYASLRAPQNGVITAILAEPGTTITAGQPIATLAGDGAREAVIDIPADYLALVQPQTKFRILPRGKEAEDPGHAQMGRLRLIEPVADAGARMHRLRITLEDDSLRLGSLVTVQLEFDDDSPVLSLPQSALVHAPRDRADAQSDKAEADRAQNDQAAPDQPHTNPAQTNPAQPNQSQPDQSQPEQPPPDKAQVWRIDPQRRLEAVTVELGPVIEGRVIIRAGIAPGDEILTRGAPAARAGQSVGERIAE